MTYEDISLDKSKTIIIFIYITTKGAPIRSVAPFLQPKKMFNSKMISGEDLLGTIDTEPMR